MKDYIKEFFFDCSGVVGIHKNTAFYHSHIFLNPVSLVNYKVITIKRGDIQYFKEFLQDRFQRRFHGELEELYRRQEALIINIEKERKEILKERMNMGIGKMIDDYLHSMTKKTEKTEKRKGMTEKRKRIETIEKKEVIEKKEEKEKIEEKIEGKTEGKTEARKEEGLETIIGLKRVLRQSIEKNK